MAFINFIPGSRPMGITRERNTFEKMLKIYCVDHHSTTLCASCTALLSKLECILGKCPFGDNKPLCSRCSSDCVDAGVRKKIADVMHYSGSRMLYRHPALTVLHFLDLLKQGPKITKQ